MSTTIRAFCLAALAAAACSHNQSASTTPSAGAAPTCDQVADRVMSKMATSDANANVAAGIRALLVNHCAKDGWSAEMRTCVMGAQVADDLDRCENQLTPAQQQALAADPMAGGGVGGGGTGTDGAAPPPTDQPANRMVSPAPKKPSDPCEGGQ